MGGTGTGEEDPVPARLALALVPAVWRVGAIVVAPECDPYHLQNSKIKWLRLVELLHTVRRVGCVYKLINERFVTVQTNS